MIQEDVSDFSKNTVAMVLAPHVHVDYELLPWRKLEVEEMVKNLYKTLSFGATGPREITTLQSSSEEWIQLRKLLIKASCLKTFTLKKTEKQLFNLVERHLWKESTARSIALDYGHKNEETAKNQYKMFPEILNLEVTNTGLWINKNFLGLGASPDVLVFDPIENSYGLLEIKCPKLMENLKPTEIYKLNKTQISRFCSKLVGNNLELKKIINIIRRFKFKWP